MNPRALFGPNRHPRSRKPLPPWFCDTKSDPALSASHSRSNVTSTIVWHDSTICCTSPFFMSAISAGVGSAGRRAAMTGCTGGTCPSFVTSWTGSPTFSVPAYMSLTNTRATRPCADATYW